jgi:hypothetical protein
MPLLTTLYCTDEDIAVRAAGDYLVLVPRDQVVARSSGASSSGWVVAGSIDYAARGVKAGHVVKLWGAKATPAGTSFGLESSPSLVAVASVATTNLTTRRKGLETGQGEPLGTFSAIEVEVVTLVPQIEDATFDLQQRFGIDEVVPGATSADLYKIRELRQACVLMVLHKLYLAQARQSAKPDDFTAKAKAYAWEVNDVLGRLALHFGATRDEQPAVQRFGRVTR